MSNFVTWLRGLAEKGGKGVVGNIDARCLGRVADELEQRDALVKALEEIVNPLGTLQKRAHANGDRLSGEAYTICNSLSYVQRIARDALSAVGGSGTP